MVFLIINSNYRHEYYPKSESLTCRSLESRVSDVRNQCREPRNEGTNPAFSKRIPIFLLFKRGMRVHLSLLEESNNDQPGENRILG